MAVGSGHRLGAYLIFEMAIFLYFSKVSLSLFLGACAAVRVTPCCARWSISTLPAAGWLELQKIRESKSTEEIPPTLAISKPVCIWFGIGQTTSKGRVSYEGLSPVQCF